MEKVGGVALPEAWEAMNTLERYRIIDRVVQIEKELANMVFPVYGSLFLRDSLPATFRQFPLPPKLDPEGLFCVDHPVNEHGGTGISWIYLRQCQKMRVPVSLPVHLLCY